MSYPAERENKYTYSDYLKTPDDKRFELIEGDLIMTPSPTVKHQAVSENISFLLSSHIRACKLGRLFYAPMDVVLDQFNVLQPDIMLVLNENKKVITEANIKGAPDLVVEIISPTSGYRDKATKKRIYERFGVKEYWVVEPQEETVEIYSLKDKKFALHQSLRKKDTLSSLLLPEFKVPLTDIFST